jgi:hypothetical protein
MLTYHGRKGALKIQINSSDNISSRESLLKYTDKRIMSIQKQIYSRPRKALKYNIPIKAFYQLIR